jgi:hypothetical protein
VFELLLVVVEREEVVLVVKVLNLKQVEEYLLQTKIESMNEMC